MLAFYRALGSIVWPFARRRLVASHPVGSDERQGIYDEQKLASIHACGANIWLHAVSVGEVQAASPIAIAAREAGWRGAITVSTVTSTGAQNAHRLIGPAMTAHIYAPWDFARIVRRAADAIAPCVYAAIETEVWPALLSELRSRRVPTMLVNARVSDRSWSRRRRMGRLMREGYALFDRVLARSEEDARRLAELMPDASRLALVGDAKVDAIARRIREHETEARSFAELVRPSRDALIFTAGSTHEGEDEVVLRAFASVRAELPSVLVLAPRHPERASAVLELARSTAPAELLSRLRDRGASERPQIVVVDTIGDLLAAYGASAAAFIGGSIAPKGGQNILEPASWGVPALHGPHMEDFAQPTRELDASGDAFEVCTADDIAALWLRIAREEGERRPAQPRCITQSAGASERIWREIDQLASASGMDAR